MTHDEDKTWAQRVASTVGAELQRARKAAGVSAEKLAEICTELGLPIKRNAIASLESGRRENVSVAELVAFASVLNVPVATLVYPIMSSPTGRTPTRVGRYGDVMEGAEWFAGNRRLPKLWNDESKKAESASARAWRVHGLMQRLYSVAEEVNTLSQMIRIGIEVYADTGDAKNEAIKNGQAFSGMSRALDSAAGILADLAKRDVSMPALSELFELEPLRSQLATRPYATDAEFGNSSADALLTQITEILKGDES